MSHPLPLLHLLLLFLALICFCLAKDTITFTTPIKDSETLLSEGGTFRFGFFAPVNNSRNRYVGIWYDKIPIQTVVWVANKNKPINDTSGVIKMNQDGNLVVTDGRNRLLWSSNVSVPVSGNSTWVQLQRTGNLVLKDNRNNGEILWQSFENPYDSFLPRMTLGTDGKTGTNTKLTSWKTPSDPSVGNYTAGIASLTFPELLIWKNNDPIWRSGPWNGQVFIGLPDMESLLFLDGFNLNNDNQGTVSMSYANDSFMYHFVLDSQGDIYQKDWSESLNDWRIGVKFPSTDCDAYAMCGPFASCNIRDNPHCRCLKGFDPKNATEWSRGIWTNGCKRRVPLQCERNNGSRGGGKGDKFLKLQRMKVPILPKRSEANEETCPKICLESCSCTAYAYDRGIGCMLWKRDLLDLQSFLGSGIDLNIRLANSEFKTTNYQPVRIAVPLIGAALVVAALILWLCRRSKKPKVIEKDRDAKLLFERMEAITSGNVVRPNLINKDNLKDLPLFEFQVLASATENFAITNKLGQGGFGPVYKGTLPEGKIIAVKRLSRASGQGIEELMNEVVVISKLQHRNLVRLLGCCIEGEERLLVYEFMPKKSLDAYLFDPTKQMLLDWKTRLSVMEGICRGLLYLHRDSRLRIIHRDLKASNILLDEHLNPKISDFGLARVFRGNEDEANTRRVVGTYGYMSPEYAMEGLFSEKSDVFSLGVILLEIISGRRNSSFHKTEKDSNLLAYAWKLWNEGEGHALADEAIYEERFKEEIERCVAIGLLCVQEVANDRPNVSTLIWMLSSQNAQLPSPKQPAFIARRVASDAESSDQSDKKASINNVSLTAVEGR